MDTLPLPKSISLVERDGHRAVFAIEPLYPGYGITVGNALRRVLLSSLAGAAITNVHFEGANHEFTTLPYVKEDIVDIILNLKKIRLKLHGTGPVTVKVKAKGAKLVTAGDIEANSDVEVITPDQPIATLTDKAGVFEAELTVESGRGYVPVEQRDAPKNAIGTIAIDAIYTPIKNVNFNTENVRVGQMTNYDRLRLDITTDGSLTPDEALRQAAATLVNHFQFITSTEASSGMTPEAPVDAMAMPVPEASPDEPKLKKRASKAKPTEETEAKE